ncbi:MAG: helix-turn-helix domain-containing protein, partial [Oricola sp.]|nr:helix-turn-helix domain-containing protein [Oricola sp.]
MSASDAGVKSVQQAVQILEAVAQISGPAQLKDVAARAGVAPSKAHRYLQSLCESGFVSQQTKSGAYDLGVGALRLGLAAIGRVDIVNRAGDALAELVEETGADAFLSVWGETAPIMVRFERSPRPTAAMMGAGVTLPALTSATGQVFLAFGNPERARLAVEREAGDDWMRAYKDINAAL